MTEASKNRIGLRGWLIIGGSGLLLGLILALVWLFYTEGGLRWALAQAQQHAPVALSIERSEGQLSGPMVLHGLQVDDEAFHLQAEAVELNWRLGMLLMGQLHVDALHIDGLSVDLREGQDPPEAESPFELPESLSVPLRINLRQLTVNQGRLSLPGETSAHSLDTLTLSGSLFRSRLRIHEVTVKADWLDLLAELDLEMKEEWPLTLSADWQLNWPDLPELTGSTGLSGDQTQLEVEQRLSGPLVLNVNGRVRQPLTEPRLDLNLRFRQLRPRQWHEDAPEGVLAGRYRLSGGLEQLRFSGGLDASDTPWGDLRLDKDVTTDLELARIQVHSLDLSHHHHAMRLEAEGDILEALGAQPRVDLALAWSDLEWPLEEPEYRSGNGYATLSGSESDFDLTLDADFSLTQIMSPLTQPIAGHIDTRLSGGAERADIEQLVVTLDDGQGLDFEGQVDWSPSGSQMEGRFALSEIDPALFDPQWPGRLSAQGRVNANWGEETITGALSLTSLSGELLGRSVSAKGRLDYQGERLLLEGVEATLGDSRIAADGVLSQDPRAGDSDLRFQIDLPELAQLPFGAQGAFMAEGEARGNLEALDLTLRAQAERLQYEAYQLASLDLDLALRAGGEQDSHLHLDLSDLQWDEETLPRLQLQADGQRSDHRLSLQAEHALLNLGVSVAGGLNADWQNDWEWSGEWLDTRLSHAAAGQWQQDQARPLNVSSQGLNVDDLCLRPVETTGALCLSGQADAQGRWSAGIDGSDFPLAMLLDQDAAGINVIGSLNVQAEAGDQGDGIEATGQIRFTPGLISQTVDGQAVTLLAIDGGLASFRWTPEAADGQLEMALSDGGFLRGEAALPQGLDGPLSGRLDAEIPELGLLPVLVAEIGRAEGLLKLGVDIGGRLDDPQLSGDIQVLDARVGLPDLGITAEAVNIFLSGDMNTLNLDLAAESGGGDLQFRAELERVDEDWLGEASLEGERFLALNIPDARVRINPDLSMAARPGRRLDVQGSLHVPWARITPGDIQAPVQASPDEIMVGEIPRSEEDDASRWAIHSRVRTSLGDDVQFDGFGLTGRISGGLTIRDEPGALTRATGELEVLEGEYSAWRQRLQIERGRLFYSDTPIDDPALDIRAVRRPRNVVVGVNIRGTLRTPQLELFSDPAMQQSEQLSYLLTGRPLTEGGEGDMDLVREAALALQVAGGGYVGRELGDRLGVDTVTIETGDSPEETQVVFGEYISPRLFISYGIGLFENVNVFRIRYEISSRWFLEAQSGPRRGADFIYSLERG